MSPWPCLEQACHPHCQALCAPDPPDAGSLPHIRATLPTSVAIVPRYLCRFPPLWVFKQHWASFCLSGAPLESHDPTGLFLLAHTPTRPRSPGWISGPLAFL